MKLSSTDRDWIDKAKRAIAAVDIGPTDEDIANAPLLSDWMPAISFYGHVILLGRVEGHPILSSTNMTSSQLIAINPEMGWARTVSRWYRLAQASPAAEESLAKVLGIKNPTAAAIKFAIPGFITMEDIASLNAVLAENISRIRKMDVAGRASSGRED